MLRRLVLLPLLALACVARADRTLVYRYEIAGSKVGESRTVVKDDGTFVGTTTLDLGQKIEATFSGRSEGQTIPEWTYTLSAQGQTITAKGDRKSASLQPKGTPDKIPIDDAFKLSAKVATFAPYLNRTLAPQISALAKGKATFDAFIFDRFTKMPVTVLGTAQRIVSGEPVTAATLRLNGSDMTLLLDRQGECIGLDVPVQKFRIVAEGFEGAFTSPVDQYPELSRATFTSERKTEGIPLRDGVALASEIIRPKTDAKVPTILIRTPYGRTSEAIVNGWYALRGYAVVVQDCRGRGDSAGVWDPFVNEGHDGEDAIAWIARQPWSNGKVGMIGASYGGFVQWAAAVRRPDALKCIVPQVSPPGSAMRNLPYVYGVPMLLSNLWWLRIVEPKSADLALATRGFPGAKRLTTLPLSRLDDAVFGHNMSMWDRWLDRDSAEKWDGWNFQSKLAGVSIPTLHISGYFDGDQIGTMLNWDTRREAGWTNQWLVYGPWPHGFNASTRMGGIDFGKDSQIDLDSVYLRFFDTYLKGKVVGWNSRPKVSAFVTGANRWLQADSWPIRESRESSLYLAGTGQGQGGALIPGPRKRDAPTRYTFDPRSVKVPASLLAPTIDLDGSLMFQRKELPDNALTFRTSPMSKALRVTGPILLDATISTSARSTDLFAIVCDEAPDGQLRRIGQHGVLRVGTKNQGDTPGTVIPNRPYAVQVRLWDFAHQFAPGHRLTLIIMSDGFPAYARNLGTGEPIATATRMVVQRNTLFHDAVRPSRLRFRVLD